MDLARNILAADYLLGNSHISKCLLLNESRSPKHAHNHQGNNLKPSKTTALPEHLIEVLGIM
eukprot:UN07816